MIKYRRKEYQWSLFNNVAIRSACRVRGDADDAPPSGNASPPPPRPVIRSLCTLPAHHIPWDENR
jgi:hypothetical protein